MEPVYATLAKRTARGDLSLRRVTAFSLDEYIGATEDSVWSFRRYLLDRLVAPTDLPPSSLHGPNGVVSDLFEEARQYETRIRQAGGIDLQLLGLGRNGHLGFNEPGSSLASPTRVKALTEETLRANRHELPSMEGAMPQAAITAGLGTILSAHSCVLLATGAAKAPAVTKTIEGPVASQCPASVLQHHPRVTIVLDEDAASGLDAAAYYRRAEQLQRQLESANGQANQR